MARLPRLTIPGFPHYIIQRGNNRQSIFSSAADHQMLLALIDENAQKFGVAVHAYVLMDNHFDMLATPASVDGLPNMMQAVGRRYVRYFNDKQRRTGSLWEGRYRSTVVDTDRYLLACMAYIDLYPVRAGLVKEASAYAWSSHAHYAGLRADKGIAPHALFWALGNTPFSRESAYAAMVARGLAPEQLDALTQLSLGGWALGDENFAIKLQKHTLRRIQKTTAGRPPSTKMQMEK
ncbi:MAG: hypothetical protein JWR74_2507 [Polaromonas sp.]|nr:hypothetical protein [Polaromonas sp.]